jgi:CRP-like cAMP-binding protein
VHVSSVNGSLDEGPDDAVRRLLAAAGVVALHAGNDIALRGTAGKLISLESGLSCLGVYTDAGVRRITAFHFPGEFCNLHRYISRDSEDDPRIAAVTNCLFRVIHAEELEEELNKSSALRLHLFNAALREIGIGRQWLLNLTRPALTRVTHLLCELFDRQQFSGAASSVIPITQIDLADATGLSAVHINRTIQQLRTLGVMTGNHQLQLADRRRLGELCGFDGSYLRVVSPLSVA